MYQPEYLQKGDTIGIVSPASFVNQELITQGIEQLKQAGFNIKIGEHTFSKHHQFAASDADRAKDLQLMLDDENIKTIIFARGGYGSLRTFALLNWHKFLAKPKWLVGFSDITVFHSALQTANIASIHGPMPGKYLLEGNQSKSFLQLVSALKGKQLNYTFDTSIYNRIGTSEGAISGGNLSVLYSIRGTKIDLNWDNKILFIEDLDEPLYHIDRMMMNLKAGKKLEKLKGIVVGSFTDMRDRNPSFGMNFQEIILDAVKSYDYPVLFDFPAGHIDENYPLIFGRKVKISSDSKQSTIQF